MSGAKKPDGRRSSDRVSFTRAAADRIARATRTVEQNLQPAAGLKINSRLVASQGEGSTIRVAVFTGQWQLNSFATITLTSGTQTLQTVSAKNTIFGLNAQGERNCIVANSGSEWLLLLPTLNSQDVLVDATLDQSLSFSRKTIGVFESSDQTDTTIPVDECPDDSASAESLSFFL